MGFTFDSQDIAKYYRLYKDLMDFWQQKYPDKIYNLSYERLTENQEEETRKLLDYLELEWEDNVLEFYKKRTQCEHRFKPSDPAENVIKVAP